MIVLGYDVHHAGPGGGGMSVGAMTATFNESKGRCFYTAAKMTSREEVATTVAGMFERKEQFNLIVIYGNHHKLLEQ